MKQPCVLCGNYTVKKLHVHGGYALISCNGCRLVFLQSLPTEADNENQYLNSLTSSFEYYAMTERMDWQTFLKRLSLIEKFQLPGQLLDVGCNVGTFMRVASERGWKTVGLEPNPLAVATAAATNANVMQGFFSPDFIGRLNVEFDLINMSEVIEHFVNPVAAVRTAAQGLKRGGILSISTPDFDSLVARRFQVKPLEHLFYFTEDTLSRLLKQCGFQIELVMHTTRRRDLRGLLHHSTTPMGSTFRLAMQFSIALGIADALSLATAQIVRDELFVIARLLNKK